MDTHRMTTIESSTTIERRRPVLVSGLAVRVLLALIISWLILLAFFVTTVASH